MQEMRELQERIKSLPVEVQEKILRFVNEKGYRPVFLREGEEVDAKESHSSSSIAFYDEWWSTLAGSPEFTETRQSKWQAGWAGGRTICYRIKFKRGDVVARKVEDGRSMEFRTVREIYICAD